MLTRRSFLKTGSLVSLSPLLPSVFAATARAAGSAVDDRVLVVIQLDGGNDGINTVVPLDDDAYGRARKALRLEAAKLHRLDDRVALHSSMKKAKDLFDEGQLTIVQGVGYPNPDRSHFRSMKIWQTASFDDADHDGYGWLGRTLDQQQVQSQANAIFVGERATPVALWGRRSTATALSRAEDLKLDADVLTGHSAPDGNSQAALRQFVTKQVSKDYAAAADFERRELETSSTDGVNYPGTKLASRLKLMSRLLRSGSQARVYYTVQDGYDTHSTQLYTHARLLREFSDALKAFINDLQAAGLEDRVVVLAFSEFGRRVHENDSQGTDHGTAGPVFLAGNAVSGGLVGEAPDLSDLEAGDLKMQIDFRRIYATLLDQWLGVRSELVLGSSFETLPFFTA